VRKKECRKTDLHLLACPENFTAFDDFLWPILTWHEMSINAANAAKDARFEILSGTAAIIA